MTRRTCKTFVWLLARELSPPHVMVTVEARQWPRLASASNSTTASSFAAMVEVECLVVTNERKQKQRDKKNERGFYERIYRPRKRRRRPRQLPSQQRRSTTVGAHEKKDKLRRRPAAERLACSSSPASSR